MNVPSVPVDQLLALSQASDEMSRSVFHRDRHATLRTVTRCVHDLLDAEYCGIFLVPEDAPHELELTAQYSDLTGHDDPPPVRLQIHSAPKGGMTGHIADQGDIVRLHGTQITGSPFYSGNVREYLASKQLQSLLAIPLKDHKNVVLGLVKVENKKSPVGPVGPVSPVGPVGSGGPLSGDGFDEADEYIARILANKIVIVLEHLRTVSVNRDLVHAIHTTRDRSSMLEEILYRSRALVRCDRGDFISWNETLGDLVIAAQLGEATFPEGSPVPTPSIVRRLWDDPSLTEIRVPDVSADPDYRAMDGRTKCQIAVKLQFEGRRIGILSVESYEVDAFDDHDLEMLHWLAHYAAIAYQVVGREAQFRGIVQRLVEHSPPRDEILNRILVSVRSIYGFTDGIIYIVDYTDRMLHCLSYIGCEGFDGDLSRLSFRFDEQALATRAFRERKGYLCMDPQSDPQISPRALRILKFDVPIVVMPLLYDQKVVGVFTLWSQSGQVAPDERHLAEMEPFARLAAANIALSETERHRSTVLESIQEILTLMQTELSREKNLRLILHGVQMAGFDRVRIFAVDETGEKLVGIDSVGMDDPDDFAGYTIIIKDNPYTESVARQSRTRPSACWFDPADSASLGRSPDAAALGKDDDLPWLAVPLVIAGQFYGLIGADNMRTRHDITPDHLEFMTVIGALAAQVIANSQTVELLRDRTRAEARSELAQRTLHALKTPAMATQIFLRHLNQAIRDETHDNGQAGELMSKIRGQIDRIAAIAEDMQRLTKLTLTPKRRVDINDVVRRTVMDGLIGEACKAEFDFADPPPFVEVNVEEIDQVITELTGNAWKVMGYSGRIHVSTRLGLASQYPRLMRRGNGQYVLINVRDTGPGIPESVRKELFSAGVSTTGGSGLGLYAIRTIAEEHQGEVWLEDTGPYGATFTFALPLA
ncbi:MAG: GAF domain-containing protein [Gemmatimonadetes bacterium]|nr:GAF domain-containing protein [Gemmatimonadota bacterium]MYG84399.1 GAF domain-containing protein [Gemmatimonadota bacterium]MYJ88275.1 GAF domain-containing protein [Gemmatimonadota bacterium]